MPQSTTVLIRYDQARHALAQCERIDEAKDWANKASALAAYAKQANDPELEASARRIRARAFRRMGELSQELEKSKPDKGHGAGLPSGGKTKASVLAEAGISTSQAHRAEKVAAIPVEEFERRVESDTPPPITVLLARAQIISSPRGTKFQNCATCGLSTQSSERSREIRQCRSLESSSLPGKQASLSRDRGKTSDRSTA